MKLKFPAGRKENISLHASRWTRCSNSPIRTETYRVICKEGRLGGSDFSSSFLTIHVGVFLFVFCFFADASQTVQ